MFLENTHDSMVWTAFAFGGYYTTCYVAYTYLYSLFVPMYVMVRIIYINHIINAELYLAVSYSSILRNRIVGKGCHK